MVVVVAVAVVVVVVVVVAGSSSYSRVGILVITSAFSSWIFSSSVRPFSSSTISIFTLILPGRIWEEKCSYDNEAHWRLNMLKECFVLPSAVKGTKTRPFRR